MRPWVLPRGRRVAVQRNFAERRRFALHQRYGDIAGHHVSAAQFEHRNGRVLLHVSHSYDRQLEIRLARVAHGRSLPAVHFVMVCVFHLPDDLVAVAFLHALAMEENHVRDAGKAGLVRAVVSGGDEKLVRNFLRGDVARAVHVIRSGHVANVEIGGMLLRLLRRLRRLRLRGLCLL